MLDLTINVATKSFDSYKYKNKRYTAYATDTEYKHIVIHFFQELFKQIVQSGMSVELPSKLGIFEIKQYNTNDLQESLALRNKHYAHVDHKVMKDLKDRGIVKIVRPDNTDTDHKWWKWCWRRSGICNFTQCQLYAFRLVRSNVRSSSNKQYNTSASRLNVSEYYKEVGHKIYPEIDLRPTINKYKSLQGDKSVIVDMSNIDQLLED